MTWLLLNCQRFNSKLLNALYQPCSAFSCFTHCTALILKEIQQTFPSRKLLFWSIKVSCSPALDYIHIHKFNEVLTGPAPLFYLKRIPNQSLAFFDISPVEPVWMSRFLLDPALNLSNKKKKKKDTQIYGGNLIFHSFTKWKNSVRYTPPNICFYQLPQNSEIQELQRGWGLSAHWLTDESPTTPELDVNKVISWQVKKQNR